MSDIFYFKENVNNNKLVRTGYLSENTKQMILKLNFVDVKVYDYFSEKYGKRREKKMEINEINELAAFRLV